jgi:hypothetical protein
MKVRVGSKYVYNPVGMDVFDPKVKLAAGTVVKVGNLPQAPKANTMGQCYVFTTDTDEFLGMVSTSSLTPAPKSRKK